MELDRYRLEDSELRRWESGAPVFPCRSGPGYDRLFNQIGGVNDIKVQAVGGGDECAASRDA
jgi:hypothetical protein